MKASSLLGRILLSAALSVFVFIAAWTAIAAFWLYNTTLDALETEADRQSREISAALDSLVWNLDERSITNYLDTKVENPEIISITVTEAVSGKVWSVPAVARRHSDSRLTTRSATIEYAGDITGRVELEMTQEPRRQQVMVSIGALVLSQILLFLAVLMAVTLSWRQVANRLNAMVAVQLAFRQNDPLARMVVTRRDELGILAAGFNALAEQVWLHNRSMEAEIHQRTESLIESEKLALVGSLVAGVAHEINTPVGNGITMASWLASRTGEVKSKIENATLTVAEMRVFLTDLDSGLRLLQTGLDRTANLIQTFKKVGTDQVIDERRPFSLRPFLEEIVVSLQPTLKQFPHQVVLECPENLTVENHPGTLFQIVTNLVMNAHHHAFLPDQAGTIRVTAELVADTALFQIHVTDNGAGMAPEVQSQIFQPFFTTKRMQGGTGLGLSIVDNLAKSLGGIIELRSEAGSGSTFTVRLPVRAPDRSS